MNVYVVVGSIGEYSEHDEWPVRVYGDEHDARAFADQAAAAGRELCQRARVALDRWLLDPDLDDSELRGLRSSLDPALNSGELVSSATNLCIGVPHDPPAYTVWEVPLDDGWVVRQAPG